MINKFYEKPLYWNKAVNHLKKNDPILKKIITRAGSKTFLTRNCTPFQTLVNAILGSARSAELNGTAKIEYLTSDEDMIIQIKSDIDIAGLQISLINDSQLDIEIKDNSHINQKSNFVWLVLIKFRVVNDSSPTLCPM